MGGHCNNKCLELVYQKSLRWVPSHLKYLFKYCVRCAKYFNTSNIFCSCCGKQLRTKFHDRNRAQELKLADNNRRRVRALRRYYENPKQYPKSTSYKDSQLAWNRAYYRRPDINLKIKQRRKIRHFIENLFKQGLNPNNNGTKKERTYSGIRFF